MIMYTLVRFIRGCRPNKLVQSPISHVPQKALSYSMRRYSSALFMSGRVASKVFAHLVPYLDADERFVNMEKLQEEIRLRGMDINVAQLKDLWEFYRKMDLDKHTLEKRLVELTNNRVQLLKSRGRTPETEGELNKIHIQQKVIREDIKTMKQAIWDMDEDVIPRILKLPSNLDPRTPIAAPIILRSVGKVPDSSEEEQKMHIEIGTKLGVLEYHNPMHYYLCNKAALFELEVLAYAERVLNNDNNMLRVTGTDFSRSLIVEGSGLNHEDPTAAFLLENHEEVERGSSNRMHLVGGATLYSFLSLHAKQKINPNDLPLKYLATGRQYIPLPADLPACGLFTACQASVAHVFAMVKDGKSEEYRTVFDELVDNVCRLYDDLCDHYRVVLRPASQLQPYEGLRVAFELWSPFAKQYIEVGYLSACGDYFSKRLLIVYQTPTGWSFPSAITGTVLSVPRLIGCLLEQNPHEFVIPSKVAKLMLLDDPIAT